MSETLVGVLLILAIPVISIVSGDDNARDTIRGLQSRVAALEAGKPANRCSAGRARSCYSALAASEPAPGNARVQVHEPCPDRGHAGIGYAGRGLGTQRVVWIGGIALAITST